MRTAALLPAALLPAFLCCLAASIRAAGEPPPKPLPEGVAAVVAGKIIPMDELGTALVRRFGDSEPGRKALENEAERLLVADEAGRRGVTVSEDEVDVYVKKAEQDVFVHSRGKQTLEKLLKSQGLTMEGFRRGARDYVLRQKLAAADLGAPGDVPPAQLALWVESLKRKHPVVIGGKDLPQGVWARAGDHLIRTPEYGRLLLRELPPARVEGTLWDIVISRAVEAKLAGWGVKIVPEDVDRAVEDLRRGFREDPRFKRTAFTFEQYVKTVRHVTVDELRKDRLFLAQVGLAKHFRGDLTGKEIREYYEKHRSRYGETRTFVHLLVKADDRPGAFGARSTRTYKEAKAKIRELYGSYLKGKPFEKLVAESSEDRSSYLAPDRLITVNRETPMPKPLRDAIFAAPLSEVVGPIRTVYGYHLVKVVDARPTPTFEQAQPRVVRDLVREKRRNALLRIRQDPAIRVASFGR